MSEGEFTDDLQRFIAQHIESVEKLEILLCLRQAPEKTWSVQDVYQKIQSSVPSVNQKLKDLSADGFVKRESNDSFRYQPKSDRLKRQVDALNAAYQTRRVKVIEAIFSKATDELRKFADAFRLRKEDE